MIQQLLYILLLCPLLACGQGEPVIQRGHTLPDLPDSLGFAGSFAGVLKGQLLVAGGANFPGNRMPWAGGQKKWYDGIYALSSVSGTWREVGRLPRSLGYGVSVTTKDHWIIIGGSNETGHYQDVYALSFQNNQLRTETWPALPVTMANSFGVVAGHRIYVLGGLVHPEDSQTQQLAFYLDLQQPQKGWTALPPLPGPSRMLGVAAAVGADLYVFSGARLAAKKRTYLKDAYRYNPQKGWTQLADLPVATVAAPSPAVSADSVIYILGGDDGNWPVRTSGKSILVSSRKILAYHIKNNTWTVAGALPVRIRKDAAVAPNKSFWAPVTVPLVYWRGQLVLPGGEVRPGTRTPHLLSLKWPFVVRSSGRLKQIK